MKIRSKCNKGNITVEAAIIFPIIFFTIIIVMFMGVFLYQETLLQSLANRAVERGAASWDNYDKDIATGNIKVDNLNGDRLYWRILESQGRAKEEKINDYIDKRMSTYSILSADHHVVKTKVKDYVVFKKLYVTVESQYVNPIGGIMKLFGLGEGFTVSVTTQSVINDPVEFIRNTDFIINLVEDLEEQNPTVAKIGNNMREVMMKLKESLNKVLDLGKGSGSEG